MKLTVKAARLSAALLALSAPLLVLTSLRKRRRRRSFAQAGSRRLRGAGHSQRCRKPRRSQRRRYQGAHQVGAKARQERGAARRSEGRARGFRRNGPPGTDYATVPSRQPAQEQQAEQPAQEQQPEQPAQEQQAEQPAQEQQPEQAAEPAAPEPPAVDEASVARAQEILGRGGSLAKPVGRRHQVRRQGGPPARQRRRPAGRCPRRSRELHHGRRQELVTRQAQQAGTAGRARTTAGSAADRSGTCRAASAVG